MAKRHTCPNNVSVACLVNRTGQGPRRCPGCGGVPLVEEGVYGVFRFDPTGRRYGVEDMAPGTRGYQNKAAAQACADRRSDAARSVDPCHRGYVVRFILNA
ncbi:MAG TPA: hypothetical protein VFH51_12060 [Myxococcota bacterium]|nr:hypothetical protein [Myxococcota bacterium]